MKKNRIAFIVFIIIPAFCFSQASDKIANQAFIITRMVSKLHVDPRPVNSSFSAEVFSGILNRTDPDKVFFMENDINRLGSYTTSLDVEIKNRKTGFLNLLIKIYQRRLKQADSLIDHMDKRPFDFYAPDKFTGAENDAYPISLAAMQQKLYKRLKADALDDMVDALPADFKTYSPAKQKKYVDSAETELRQKTAIAFKRKVSTILQNPIGIAQYLGNIYCETIASCFDPHTEFFPPEEKENFESELGKQPFQFGFKIRGDKNGGVYIDNLEPGSPAFRGGKLNKGDRFLSVQWEGSDPIDVTDISTEDFGALLGESNHKKATFTIKKTDGSIIKVPLEKEQAVGDDDDKVKSFILKGPGYSVGYIYLPVFYEDWEANNQGLNGCANDVGREILKLKKEHIQGIILDLRYNGGGSAEEATELAGIFIDAGPVQQEKSRDAKVYTLKDINAGTIYDGPLAILVNGYSASASEIVAGALQDYSRAVIIGSPTYGKATAQIVFPMDTTVTPDNFEKLQTENYLKITVSKLYRITGNTAQFKGVKPDILLPDLLDAYSNKEADDPHALKPNTIAANKYYTPYSPLPVAALAQSVQPEIDTSRYFNAVKNFVAWSKAQKAVKDVPINLNDALAGTSGASADDGIIGSGVPTKKFTVQNNQYELARIQGDSYLKELNDEFGKQVSTDPAIAIAYEVLGRFKTQ